MKNNTAAEDVYHLHLVGLLLLLVQLQHLKSGFVRNSVARAYHSKYRN